MLAVYSSEFEYTIIGIAYSLLVILGVVAPPNHLFRPFIFQNFHISAKHHPTKEKPVTKIYCCHGIGFIVSHPFTGSICSEQNAVRPSRLREASIALRVGKPSASSEAMKVVFLVVIRSSRCCASLSVFIGLCLFHFLGIWVVF